MLTQTEVIEQIKQAFKDVQYPGDDKLVEPEEFYKDVDYLETEAAFKGKTWQFLSSEFLEKNRSGLSFLSKIALQYFLPAFLIGAIFDRKIGDIEDAIVHWSRPPYYNTSKEFLVYKIAIVKTFNRAQREALLNTLLYIHQEDKYRNYKTQDIKDTINFWLEANTFETSERHSNDWHYARLAYNYLRDRDTVLFFLNMTKAIELNPNETAYYNARGDLHQAMEHYEESIQDFSASLKIDPNDDFILYRRMSAYFIIQDYEKAIVDIDRLLELTPDNPEDSYSLAKLFCLKAQSYRELEKYEDALANYDIAISKSPNNVDWVYERSLTHFRLHQFEEAADDLRQVILLSSENQYMRRDAEYYLEMAVNHKSPFE